MSCSGPQPDGRTVVPNPTVSDEPTSFPGGGGGSPAEMEADGEFDAEEPVLVEDDVDGDAGGEEEGDDDDEEEGYRLRFDGETDPLNLAAEAADGVELYRQFERLEYEALAERKRKALADRQPREEPPKKRMHDDLSGATMAEIEELMNFAGGGRRRRRSKDLKKKGRRKGSRNKLSSEITRKIADATFHYASGSYSLAIPLLEEAVRLAPNVPDSYYVLGLIYDAMGDKNKAINFHMIAAHLKPKDPTLWKKLIAWSIEQGNSGQVRYCLSKAITADPKDVGLRFDRALLHFDLGEYQKAAETYERIVGMYPANVEARIMAAKMYKKCGQVERAICVLEDYVNGYSSEADTSVVKLLIDLLMEANAHVKALKHIEHAHSLYGSKKKLPLYLSLKAAVCHAYLGNMEDAEVFLQDVQLEHVEDNAELTTVVADSFANIGQYDFALKLYFMLKGIAGHENGSLYLKIAHCYASMKERGKAISFYYKALPAMDNNVDARITLSSLLVEEGKEDDAIVVLSAPKDCVTAPVSDLNSTQSKPWWVNGKIQVQLAKIYLAKGMLEAFADAIFSSIRETLVIESMNHKLKVRKKRLSESVLFERRKLLDEHQADNVFHGFKPIATTSDLLKASRAKKALQKKEALREEKKAAAVAAGLDWQSEDSEDDAPLKETREPREPPLPGLLNDEEHHQLIFDLCNALLSLQRYWEAFEIIYHTLRVAQKNLSTEKKEELRSLGAQIAYKTKDPRHGFLYARYIVQQHPQSIAAWNFYYKVISRFENPLLPHFKFLLRMRTRHEDLVPPMVIHGHQFTQHSQHQAAAREYLEAYKLQPENPLINLCVGTSLINLALGFRLQNKHHCVAQGLAFLYNYLRICHNSQEALYNIARAYHHVGLVTLAAKYYEKVLAVEEKDYPIPKLTFEDPVIRGKVKPGYCDLHREAAYNLHLIYKKSGAVDLARQVLKDYCVI